MIHYSYIKCTHSLHTAEITLTVINNQNRFASQPVGPYSKCQETQNYHSVINSRSVEASTHSKVNNPSGLPCLTPVVPKSSFTVFLPPWPSSLPPVVLSSSCVDPKYFRNFFFLPPQAPVSRYLELLVMKTDPIQLSRLWQWWKTTWRSI